jgi:hypothetical protein
MKIVLILVASLGALIALVALIGAFLPRSHVATRAATYRQTPAELYAIVRAFEQASTWRSDLKTVELLPADAGRPAFREHQKHDAIAYRVLEERPGEKLVTEIADPTLPFGGTWTYVFTPAPAGSTLRITERGEVKNVIFRFVARFVIGHTGTMESVLRDLGRKVGEDVVPTP